MKVSLHKLARTTPAIRREIQSSHLSYAQLAKKYNINVSTVSKWKNRKSVEDKSHARHNTLSSLNEAEEELVVELRTKVGLSLDDITEVMHRCLNPSLSRSAIYRTLKRRGATERPKIEEEKTIKSQPFEVVDKPGYIHMDVKYLTKLDGKRAYVYVAIDRQTRFVYVEVHYNLEPKTSSEFIERFSASFPCKIIKIITDNGFEWTDRCSGGVKNKPTGNHPVDVVCKARDITHTLTRIRRPQTNGMVERFNRRINEALARKSKIAKNSGKNSFHSHEERNAFILQFVDNYNKTRLRCLNYNAPLFLLYDNHTEDNTQAGIF